MATRTVEFDCPSGLTLTFAVYAFGADTALAIGAAGETYASATEKTNDKGCYSVSAVNLASATYCARAYLADGTTVGRGVLEHTNSTGTERVRVDESTTSVSASAAGAANLTTGYVVCYGTDGLVEASVSIYAKMVGGVGTDAFAHDTATITLTSDATGLAQHTGFVQGATYIFSRGTAGVWTDPEVAPSTSTWALPEILGSP